MRPINRLAANFLRDGSGNFAILTAVTASLLMIAVGFGVNTAQVYNIRSGLGQALDAAVTSTARDLTTGIIKPDDARKWIELFLKVNGDPEFTSDDRLVLENIVVDQTKKTVQATAYVDTTVFFPVFTQNHPRVRATSAAIYSDKRVEIAMMLDVTGSMAKSGKLDKIGDLKKAATNAVNMVLKNQDAKNPRVRVALVPYASGVNVGGLAPNIYAEKASSSDLPPVTGTAVVGKTLPAYADYIKAVAKEFPRGDACATERKTKDGKPDMSSDGPDTVRADKDGKKYYAMVNRDNNLSGSGMNQCPDAKVIPLTADSKSLLDSIDDFEANGYTAGAIAIQWTYYMLSSSWRSVIKDAGLGDGPADRDDKKIHKVAILMTDGQFNTAYASVSSNFNSQGSKSRTNAESLCTNMKAEGIEVFTIGFDLNNKSMSQTERDQAKGVLKNCASTDVSAIKHYFEVSTGDELDAAFQEIISNTERLALTQ